METIRNGLHIDDIQDELSEVLSGGKITLFVKAVYTAVPSGDWLLHSTYITEYKETDEEVFHVYPQATFISCTVKIQSINHLFTLLNTDGLILHDDFPSIKPESENNWEEERVPSHITDSKWPARIYHNRTFTGKLAGNDFKLIAHGLPYRESYNQHLATFYPELDINKLGFNILIFDTRYRLIDENGNLSSNQHDEIYACGEFETLDDDTRHTFPAKDSISIQDIDVPEIWAVDKQNRLMDYISCSAWPHRFEVSSNKNLKKRITKLVNSGESQSCEYKKYIDISELPAKTEEILRTICAFSNCQGGTLIIGVSNGGDIIGIQEGIKKNYKELLEEGTQAYINDLRMILTEGLAVLECFELQSVQISDCMLVIIQVSKASSLNYLHKDKMPYMRTGATNYKATNMLIRPQ